MENSQNIFDFVVQFLNEQKSSWTYERYKEETVIILGMQGHHGIKFRVVIDVKEDEKTILVYSIIAIYAMEDKKIAASELVNRLNYGLVVGNFEFDFEDGEIRFKNSIECKGIELTYEFIDILIMRSIITLDNASKCLIDVLLNGVSPAEAHQAFRGENEYAFANGEE
jgi:hypothetical protein